MRPDARIRDLTRQLESEQRAHAQTRQELTRVWRLVPSHYINLMGVYPALRKLLYVLAEAADLQDPSRGAPIEDTMRTHYIPDGENASTSATERGVLTHQRHRHNVRVINGELAHLSEDFDRRLDDKTHWLAKLIGGEEWAYPLPERPVCHRKTCPKRGVKQALSAWRDGCAGCGRMFEKEMANG